MGTVGLALLIAVVAALYASVGLAGATGYLALMALFGVDAETMKPAALLLNGLVAVVGTLVFGRTRERGRPAGMFGPIVAAAIPTAFLGGAIRLPARVYLPVVGAIMITSAARLLLPVRNRVGASATRRVPTGAAAALGAGVGLASGLTGTGGGIFLLPALQLLGWSGPRESATVVAPFVMLTSAAGLVGYLAAAPALPPTLALWAPAAAVGGLIGARTGRDRLDPRALRRVLALLLLAAGARLLVP